LGWFDAVMALAALGAVLMIVQRTMQPPSSPRVDSPGAEAGHPPTATGTRTALPAEPAPADAWAPPPAPSFSAPLAGLPPVRLDGEPARAAWPAAFSAEDGAAFAALGSVIAARGEIDSSHVDTVERLQRAYPGVPALDQAVEAVLETAAAQAASRGRQVDAARYREEAAELLPDRPSVWLRLIAMHEQVRAWPDAERASRRALSSLPDESALHLALARAVSQQGRDDEAADVLRRRLTARSDPAARAMLSRLEASLASVAGLARRNSSHFSVMFEGDADDALGRSLVDMLEQKYAMLSRTLDFEPTQAIPVILYPRQAFLATGAPGWSGATYSHGDGRIRIGTRNMSAGIVPLDLERTLTHELTHAFVFGASRGALPRDVNEGLAQYLSGARLGYRLDASRVAGTNQLVKVDDFYDSALSFVEFLLDRYRQPAMNDLLKYTGETGSADQGFRRAYHQGYQEARQEWIKSLGPR
jgi:tetratricopeptide (TPR) repeat protein